IDPTQKEQISLAMDLLLSDSSLYTRLRQEAVLQAAKFTWRKTAEQTLTAYEEVVSDAKSSRS
ncbi:MAG TPA: hypothetical protein VGE93_13135, partial [Bryobacteraceae bacterium]